MNQRKRNNNFRGGRRRTTQRRKQRGEFSNKQSGNLITRDNPRFPNDIKQLPIFSRAIRYISTGTVTAYPWTAKNLLYSMFWATNTSTTATALFGSVRLRRVSMYFVPSTGDFGASASVLTFSWVGTTNAPDNLIIDRGTATMPACIKTKPITNSQSGFWYDINSAGILNALFQISCPADTIIDIEFEFTLNPVQNGNTLTLSVGAGYTGVTFLGYDGALIVPDGGVGTGHV